MNNLSFHITDITANSVRAKASRVFIAIDINKEVITIETKDNGCGMDEDMIRRVTNPFYTTRSTRKVGLGLPFLIQNAEQTGGSVTIESRVGEGTTVIARFISTHIDCPPWGDLPGTIAMLITGNPEVSIHFKYQQEEAVFAINTEELREALDGVPLSHPQVTQWLNEMIRENIQLISSV